MLKKLILGLVFAFSMVGFAQQPQTNNIPPTQPIFATNAKWVNGVAPGYWVTTPSTTGLSVNISSGTANCSGIVTYAGGTFILTNNTTNYIYLNTASSCVPTISTSIFVSGQIPIAIVVTSGGNITSIQDVRTPFFTATSSSSGLYELKTFIGGQLSTGSIIVLQDATSLPWGTGTNCAGLNGTIATAYASTEAGATTTFTFYKNGSSFGTAVFSTSSHYGTVTCTATNFSPTGNSGSPDVLTILYQASPDSNIANVSISIAGTR